MEHTYSQCVIIGAGLSGLTSAYQLYQAGITDFIVLESRNRIGGRVLTENHIDFGATWFQTHHSSVISLLEKLRVKNFHQYTAGNSVLVYSTMAPEHYFEPDPKAPTALRIRGGSQTIIKELARPIREKIHLKTKVMAIRETERGVLIATENGEHYSEKAIITIPPQLATTISYQPALPNDAMEVMSSTHTWMSNAMKVGLTFKEPFWRNLNLSGTIIGQVGPVVELYDHCNFEHTHFALMGFINEGLRDLGAEQRKSLILNYITRFFGKQVFEYLTYSEKDWTEDEHTSNNNIKSIYMSPIYGNPVFEESYMNGKLWFSGAETSEVHGGYMDGAILSGIKAAASLVLKNEL